AAPSPARPSATARDGAPHRAPARRQRAAALPCRHSSPHSPPVGRRRTAMAITSPASGDLAGVPEAASFPGRRSASRQARGFRRSCKCPVAVGVALQLLRIPPPHEMSADPEGGAHGCAPFFDEGRMPSRKIPSSMKSPVCRWHKALSLVRFFDANQRNELGRAADETLLLLVLAPTRR